MGDGQVSPKGPIETATNATEPEPEPFDLESIIRAKTADRASDETSDPFDPARLRLSQDFASAIRVKRVITTIPVRKPSRESFVRTHHDQAYWLPTAVLELKEDRETYLVMPELWPALASEATFSPRLLVAAVNRANIPFIWPIRLPGEDGKIDDWNRSAMGAAEMAKTSWVRVSANMGLGAYEVAVAPALQATPEWPDLSFSKMLEIGFRGKMITSLDHPVLRRLRGEV
jgi:hypothetical protein